MHKLIFILFCLLCKNSFSQENCNDCETKFVHFAPFDFLDITLRRDTSFLSQQDKLQSLDFKIFEQLAYNSALTGNCTYIHWGSGKGSFVDAGSGEYKIFGNIRNTKDDQWKHLKIWLQDPCSGKTLAQTELSFQIYPSFDADKTAEQVATQFSPLIKARESYALQQRAATGNPILSNGRIKMDVEPRLRTGAVTDVVLHMSDCDGEHLKRKEITFEGTTGGTFLSSKVVTDEYGTAKVKFKFTSTSKAVLKANCHTKNIGGCDATFKGSAMITTGPPPVKVEIEYVGSVSNKLKRGTLPGVIVEGGEETDETNMRHTSVLYYYPSASDLKQGILVVATHENPSAKTKTDYIEDYGSYHFSKNKRPAIIKVLAGDIPMAVDNEKGEQEEITGVAPFSYHSQVIFKKRQGNDSAFISWAINYPAKSGSEKVEVGTSMTVHENDKKAEWKVIKIKDSNSPYKTQYLITLKVDAAEELKDGNKAMKTIFGFDVDELVNVIDPTKPKTDIATAFGFRLIRIKISSPYTD